ncbi:MAG TPA: hypothetical protein PKD00_03280 [Burkholderiales bacterium]|nr:hypothetical protein [Burkholderiales bacterium]
MVICELVKTYSSQINFADMKKFKISIVEINYNGKKVKGDKISKPFKVKETVVMREDLWGQDALNYIANFLKSTPKREESKAMMKKFYPKGKF